MFLLPNIGLNKMNPDILIRIRENKVSCAILPIAMSPLLTSALYQPEYPYGKFLEHLQHAAAAEDENDADHQ